MDQRDAIIRELRQTIAELKAQLHEPSQRIQQLELELAKAKTNSSTSSKPPSSDITKPPSKSTRTGGRRRRRQGGQPGHTQHLRQPLPPERVHEIHEYEIDDVDHDFWPLGSDETSIKDNGKKHWIGCITAHLEGQPAPSLLS